MSKNWEIKLQKILWIFFTIDFTCHWPMANHVKVNCIKFCKSVAIKINLFPNFWYICRYFQNNIYIITKEHIYSLIITYKTNIIIKIHPKVYIHVVKLFHFFSKSNNFRSSYGQFGKFTDIWANFLSLKNDGRNVKEQEKCF